MGPSLAALILTALLDGGPGLVALRARCRPPAAGRWWLALLLIPAVTAPTPLLRAWAGAPVDVGAMRARLGPGLAPGLAAGLMEEFGWRGFLLPRLRQRHPAMHRLCRNGGGRRSVQRWPGVPLPGCGALVPRVVMPGGHRPLTTVDGRPAK